MELLQGIETRRSFRAFKSTPIPKEIIGKILKAAGSSPSHMNTQPWEVAVLSGKKKEELGRVLFELAKSDVTPNPDFPLPETWPTEMERRIKEHGARRFKILGIEQEDRQKREELRLSNFEFYGAPCVLFLFMDSMLSSWSILDMGLFAQGIVLAAHSFGLGSCLQATLAHYPDTVRKFLGIPETRRLILGISIGYPDIEARINTYHSEKVSPDDFVQWHT